MGQLLQYLIGILSAGCVWSLVFISFFEISVTLVRTDQEYKVPMLHKPNNNFI